MVPQADRGLNSWIFRGDEGRTSHHAQGENAFEYDIRPLRLPQTGLPQRRISHTNRNRPIQMY